MRWGLLLVFGTILAACNPVPPVVPSNPIAQATIVLPTPTQPSATVTLTPMPPSSTFTLTSSDTDTPTTTFTIPFTDTPTDTPRLLSHIFPLQPVNGTGFSEGTASHGYPATDIFAPVGTKFVAVTDGVVDFVSFTDTWDPKTDDPAVRGGLSVAIIGDDGVRYYGSHLSAIAKSIQPGVRVQVGQLLGLVGNSGDARATDSHLHFGISRPTTPDDWKARRGQVDPFPFLQAWRDGHNVTPPLPEP